MSIRNRRRQFGLSLIELIMFIIIVGIAVAGVLSVMNQVSASSADPMLRRQAQAIAEALLEEIELQPSTFCDPDDANAATATSAAGCASATTRETLGPEAGESRFTSPQFDNVNDYNGYSMSPIVDITNTAVAGLGAYTASVAITEDGAAFGLAADAVHRIDVRAQAGTTDITVTGYRFRYAPNAVP